MSTIKVRCDDQRMTFTNTPLIATGGVNENYIEFSFCSQWDGFAKVCVFYQQPGAHYHTLLDSADSGVIPAEVCAEPGPMFFGVIGVKGDITRTSEVLKYRLVEGVMTEITDPADDVYQQILAQFAEARTLYNEAIQTVVGKADMVAGATEGNLAGLDVNGNLVDSGKKPADFHPEVAGLPTLSALANDDYVPIYDTSGAAHKKTLWSTIVSKLRTAFFGTSSGLLKADGSGNVSVAQEGVDYPAPLGAGDVKANHIEKGAVSKSLTITLAVANWANKEQTVTANGVTDSNTVIISPAPENHQSYGEAQIRCTEQAANSLTFTCEEVPTTEITVNACVINK